MSRLETSTQNIKDGAQSLSQGMTNIDPLALKRLVQENDELRKQLESIRSQLNSTFVPASIGISPTTGFKLAITGSSGDLSLSAWLDDPNHLFFQDQPVHDRQAVLQFKNTFGKEQIAGSMEACQHQPEVRDKTACFLLYVLPASGGDKGTQIDGMYKDAITRAFQDFLSQPTFIPAPDAEVSAIQHWTMATGEHQLHFQVIPKKLNNGVWFLSYKTYFVTPNEKEEVVFQDSLSGSSLEPVHRIITTFPVVVSSN